MAQQVHWHEGLFLQPHHLQVMQRQLIERMVAERRLAWAYPYGVVECQVSESALQTARVEVTRLRAVMRSGLEVVYPGGADLPPLDVTRALETAGGGSLLVSLAVPQWQERRPNASGADEQAVSDALYRVYPAQVFDENTGANAQPIPLRRVNARLVVEDEGEVAGFETLPLLRIKRGVGQAVGKPVRDTYFVPPCMTLSGSADLRRMVEAVADALEATRKGLIPEVVKDGFNYEALRGSQYGHVLKLRTVSRFAARLPALAQAAGAVSPFQVYLELRELLAELAALEPVRDMKEGLFDVPAYSHEEPAISFSALTEKILSLLEEVVEQTVLTVEFKDVGGVPTAALEADHLQRPNEYYLGVLTAGNPTALEQLVLDPDHFKVMARTVIQRAIRGIKLSLARVLPPGLPRQEGLYYFTLDRTASSKARWDEVAAEKTMAIKKPPGEFGDARFTLYMTIPVGAAAAAAAASAATTPAGAGAQG